MFTKEDGEPKSPRRRDMTADKIGTFAAAVVCQMGGYIAVRVGVKVAPTNVQASIEYQLNRIENILASRL